MQVGINIDKSTSNIEPSADNKLSPKEGNYQTPVQLVAQIQAKL